MIQLNRAAKGYFWTLTELFFKSGTEFFIQIILARILLPEDFGILGLITVFIALATTISNSGFSQALIRETELLDKDFSTVFIYTMFLSLILYFLLFLSSNYIALFFNDNRLKNVIRIIGFVVVSNSLLIVPLAKFSRQMNFKIQAVTNSAASLISGIVAIGLALLGFGYWALVVKMLISSLIYSVSLFIISRWHPKMVFDKNSFKKFFSFGWKLLLTGLLAQLYQNIYYLIIGRSFSQADLGYYTNAKRLKDLPAQTLTMTVSKVAYPMLSECKEDREKLQLKFKVVLVGSAFVVFPLLLLLSAMADTVIIVLFGDNWIPAIPYFRILCLAGLTYPLGAVNLTILNVHGRSDLFLYVDSLKIVIGLFIILFVILFNLGIIGLLWSTVFNSIIAYFLNAFFSAKVTAYSVQEQTRELFPILINSIIVFTLLFFLNNSLNISIYSKFLLFPLIGLSLYSLLTFLFMRRQFQFLNMMLFAKD